MSSRIQSLAVRLIAKAAGAGAVYAGLSLLSGLLSLSYALDPVIQALAGFVGVALVVAGVLAILS
ncbi:MAG: hypothetical protein NZ733_06430 [Aigarchaeota archaeon]|nr:hypothetical protein [Aigarchaeota archaeon]MCX8202752.1 hypothetical protein [Nitrososphaeria archaeon]MDW8044066.1 hypothetical protein [Nitrososphaerota archaeon]